VFQQQVGDLAQLLGGELAEDDDLVDAVEELGAEVLAQRAQDHARAGPPRPRRRRRAEADTGAAPGDRLGAEVAGHHDHGVLEVDRAALRVGQPPSSRTWSRMLKTSGCAFSTSSSSSTSTGAGGRPR
jgi:hypothetical protein